MFALAPATQSARPLGASRRLSVKSSAAGQRNPPEPGRASADLKAGPGPGSQRAIWRRQDRHSFPRRLISTYAATGDPFPWAFMPWQKETVTYSNDPGSVSPEEVRDLWVACFGRNLAPEKRDLRRIARALQHSFTIQAAFAEARPSAAGNSGQKKLIGFARTESDGAFVAVIWDLCVHPDYRGRGYGREVLQKLVKHTRLAGASGFAAFPRPMERLFFFRNDFRWNSRYRIMRYCPEPSRPGDSSAPPSPEAAGSQGSDDMADG